MIKKTSAASSYMQNPYYNNLYFKTIKKEKKVTQTDTVNISKEAMKLYQKSVQK